MKLNFKWVLDGSGEDLYINRINAGSYSWNASRTRGESHENNDYIGSTTLPGLSHKTFLDGSREKIKEQIENCVKSWFNEALK